MSKINTAAKGRRLEHKTIRRLELQGYDCTRSAGSKGKWDIIAIGENGIKLVQVKANRPPGSKECREMIQASVPHNATKEYWVWKDNAREPIIKVF